VNKIKIRKKTPRKAYSSSLIQQHFGELPENHGYLLWDIENSDVEEINIDNDYKFINVEINQKTDIDNLKIDIQKNDKIKVKIKWSDFSNNMNFENERKIREIVKNITGTESIQIESRPLYTDINDSKLLSDTIDINDKIIQQNILKEFLVGNKIDDDKIKNIIEIDNIINNRLNINKSKNIKWSIDKFWFNNFKSYGDNNKINWENKNGIIQIGGINQQGKSTILDAISYILYGTTMATQKREKNGDNRYININRKKDYCDGGAIININGEKYLIYRKTERKVKKTGDIISVSTQLEYYKGVDMIEDNKLVGEKRTDTQKILESVLGDFNDFIRLTLTSADNVNDLLSMDRSQFIDNIIKDAGYDIFDKKLSEFKEYKKELNLEKINLNISQIEKDINKIKDEIDIHNNFIKDNNKKIELINQKLKYNQKEKENLISKINKIDEKIMLIDYDNLNKLSENNKKKIDEYNNDINKMKLNISVYPDKFDSKLLTEKRIIYDNYKDDYVKIKDEIKLIEKEKYEKEYKLKDIDNKIENKLKDIDKNIKYNINNIENNIKIINNNINIIKKDGLKIKKDIESLENSINGDEKNCPVCLKPLNDKDSEHFINEINKKKLELKNLSNNGKEKLKEKELLLDKIINLNSIDILKTDEYLNFIKEINNDRKILEKEISYLNVNEKIKELKNYEPKILEIKNDINELDKIKEKYDYRLTIESKIKDIKIEINKLLDENNKIQNQLIDYLKNKEFIDENKKIKIDINKITEIINEQEIEIKKITDEIFDNKQNITLKNKVIDDYEEKIDKYNKQVELDFIHNIYLKSMHRDGLPTYLLKKSIHIINNELSVLLNNVDFNLLFDDNLNLKMKSKTSSNFYNAVEGSGMERTFNSVVLKIALRKINNTSKPNFILFDEIMNKLVEKSVDYFIDLLYILKEHIDKIILIEHIHQLRYDYLINVKKDDNKISSFEIL